MNEDHQCGFQRNTSATDKTLFRQTQKKKKSQTLYCNVTFRRVRVTVVVVLKQYILKIMGSVCILALGFGKKSACAPLYSHLWPIWF